MPTETMSDFENAERVLRSRTQKLLGGNISLFMFSYNIVTKDYRSHIENVDLTIHIFLTLNVCISENILRILLKCAALIWVDNHRQNNCIRIQYAWFVDTQGLAPQYLSQLARVADLPSRRRLRSSSTHQLRVTPFCLSTVGRRSFPIAAAILSNKLPVDVELSPSLPVFRQRLKTFPLPHIISWC